MQAVKTYKTHSQLKGERYLRCRNLLVPPSTQRNIEKVKFKARALRLKEEYRRKYLSRRRPQRAPEELVIVPDYIEGVTSKIRRTLTFCITLWFSFLIAIAICILAGYCFRHILSK